jgi:hypothetical protein
MLKLFDHQPNQYMKPSMHLIYGIIIGILICACTAGSPNEDYEEFFEQHFPRGKTIQAHPLFKTMLNDGWTPIDFEIAGPDLLVIFGK